MSILIKLVSVFYIFTTINCEKVCFDGYGCFTDEYPFGNSEARPFSLLPQDPSRINTEFYLYNRNNPTDGEQISSSNFGRFYNSSLPTKIVVHGFFNTHTQGWLINIKDIFLKHLDLNVIIIDWSGGSGLPYTLATANTQVVGVEIANFIQAAIDKKIANINDFHCIGHSLGAHICGYAGKRLNGRLPRISGMDAAGPYFENTPPIVRLDKTDAVFVDGIHTNAKKWVGDTTSIGIREAYAHVDIYANGGEFQPGCWLTDGTVDPRCSHMSVCKFYTDSIENKCKFTAYPCDSTDEYYKGNCLRCSSKGCNRMGYWASPERDIGTLYLDTQSVYNEDKCKHNYQVTMTSDDVGDKLAKGKFTIYFKTNDESSSTETLENGNIIFSANSIEESLVSINNQMKGEIKSAFISYTRGWNFWSYENKWIFKSIEIFSAETQKTVKLCPEPDVFMVGNTLEYKTC